MTSDPVQNVAIVAIGRNEGERLKSCLRAAIAAAQTVVYVDSGSSDGSAEFARSLSCHVVEMHPPYSAARARNQGFAAGMALDPDAEFIQFVDGDCTLVDGWLDQGMAAFRERQDAGIVCGHVREIHPEASVYNRLFDLEWRQQPGTLSACGGIFMMRPETFRGLGGFRPEVIAAEDNEFCVRVRRTGHAYAQVAALHGQSNERYYVQECRRVWIWGFAIPFFALALAPFTRGISLMLLFLYGPQFGWIVRRARKRGWPLADAFVYSGFTVLTKFPALEGMLAYYWRRMRGKTITIMEHKES